MLPLSPHQSQVLSLAYSADSSLLASGDRDGVIQIHNLATGEVKSTLPGNIEVKDQLFEVKNGFRNDLAVMDLAFSPDDETLAVSWGRQVTFFDLSTGIEHQFEEMMSGGSCTVAFTKGGSQLLVTSYTERHIAFHKTDTGAEVLRWEGQQEGILSLCVSRDGQWLVTGGGRDMLGEVLLWDLRLKGLIRPFQQRFTHTYLTCERDYNWELRTYMREEQLNTGHAMAVYAVAISPDSRYIASGGKEGMVKIWDRATGDLLAMHNHESRIVSTQFTQGNDLLLVAEEEGLVHIYDIKGGNLIRTIDQDLGTLSSMIFSPNGMTAAVGSKRGEVLVWDLDF